MNNLPTKGFRLTATITVESLDRSILESYERWLKNTGELMSRIGNSSEVQVTIEEACLFFTGGLK
jgi:hypothetical protein